MAAGAGFYNAQGVWQYGETDNIGTLFSDFMNVAPISITTQFVADRSRLTALETLTNNPTVFVAASSAARDTKWGTPTTSSTQLALQNKGATTIRTDTGIVERYFATYNVSTNPGGMKTPGWLPISGLVPSFMALANVSQSITTGNWTTLASAIPTATISRGFTSYTGGALTIATEGTYRVSNSISYASSTSVGAVVNKNNATMATTSAWIAYAQATANSAYCSAVVQLAAGDVLRFGTAQTSGGNLSTQGLGSYVSVEYLYPRQT